MKKQVMIWSTIVVLTFLVFGCPTPDFSSQSVTRTNSGVQKAEANIKAGVDGLTTEQRNVKKRGEMDNKLGVVKHLYVISSYSGKVLLYSTVDGKVTSSTKRLEPKTVAALSGQYNSQGDYIPVNVNQNQYRTTEVLGDDGTYGESGNYLFWWDTNGNYHQLYATGGQMIAVEEQPLAIPMEGVIVLGKR